MSLPKQFQSAQFQVMTFRNGDRVWNRNTVHMQINEHAITGFYRSGKRNLRGLPTDYETYELYYDEGAVLTVGDFRALFTWTNAKQLFVYDMNTIDFAFKFSMKIDKMSAMTSLEEISMKLYSHTLESININDFLTKLPALKKARFLFSSHIEDAARERFVKNLKVAKAWICTVGHATVPIRIRDANFLTTYDTLECSYKGGKKQKGNDTE